MTKKMLVDINLGSWKKVTRRLNSYWIWNCIHIFHQVPSKELNFRKMLQCYALWIKFEFLELKSESGDTLNAIIKIIREYNNPYFDSFPIFLTSLNLFISSCILQPSVLSRTINLDFLGTSLQFHLTEAS